MLNLFIFIFTDFKIVKQSLIINFTFFNLDKVYLSILISSYFIKITLLGFHKNSKFLRTIALIYYL